MVLHGVEFRNKITGRKVIIFPFNTTKKLWRVFTEIDDKILQFEIRDGDRLDKFLKKSCEFVKQRITNV